MGTDLCQCVLMATLQWCSTRRPGLKHQDLISHTGLILNQPVPALSLLCPSAKLDREKYKSCKSLIHLIWPGFDQDIATVCVLSQVGTSLGITIYVSRMQNPNMLCIETRRDGRLSRASISHFGSSGDSDLVGSNPRQVKPALKLILVTS